MSSEQEIVRKCVKENKKSVEILKWASHLMQVIEEGYDAMKMAWSPQHRLLTFDSGPIDIFNEELVQIGINPVVKYLRKLKEEDVSFTEFSFDDKTKPPIVKQTESWRESANDMAKEAQTLCEEFIANRAALNQFVPILNYAYFMAHASQLSQNATKLLQDITGNYFTLLIVNRQYREEYGLNKQEMLKLSAVSQPMLLAPPKAEEKSKQSDSLRNTSQWTRRTLGTEL